jgi:hypothetical protein
MQTFYQPLFSNSPLAISLQQFFSLPKTSHTKKPKAHGKKPSPSQIKSLKEKTSCPLSGGILYPVVNRVEQQFSGRGMTL